MHRLFLSSFSDHHRADGHAVYGRAVLEQVAGVSGDAEAGHEDFSVPRDRIENFQESAEGQLLIFHEAHVCGRTTTAARVRRPARVESMPARSIATCLQIKIKDSWSGSTFPDPCPPRPETVTRETVKPTRRTKVV